MNRMIRRSSMLICMLLCMVAGAVKHSMLFANAARLSEFAGNNIPRPIFAT